MKEKLVILLVIFCLVLAFGWALNKTLSYYDPPKNIDWVKWKIPRDMYLWQVASDLSNQFRKHPDALVKIIYKENNLNDYFLKEGETILKPEPK